ncbi:MAG: hypothetical protein QXO76_00010 [Thermoproteota archaeon]
MKLRKLSKVIVIGLALSIGTCGCVSTGSVKSYESATFLGAVGAGVGALVDSDNRWRGATIGGVLGGITGYGLSEIQQQEQGYYPSQPQPYPYQGYRGYPGGPPMNRY